MFLRVCRISKELFFVRIDNIFKNLVVWIKWGGRLMKSKWCLK